MLLVLLSLYFDFIYYLFILSLYIELLVVLCIGLYYFQLYYLNWLTICILYYYFQPYQLFWLTIILYMLYVIFLLLLLSLLLVDYYLTLYFQLNASHVNKGYHYFQLLTWLTIILLIMLNKFINYYFFCYILFIFIQFNIS